MWAHLTGLHFEVRALKISPTFRTRLAGDGRARVPLCWANTPPTSPPPAGRCCAASRRGSSCRRTTGTRRCQSPPSTPVAHRPTPARGACPSPRSWRREPPTLSAVAAVAWPRCTQLVTEYHHGMDFEVQEDLDVQEFEWSQAVMHALYVGLRRLALQADAEGGRRTDKVRQMTTEGVTHLRSDQACAR